MSTAEEFKAQGNAALQAGNFTQAIEMYTKAINADGSNHVYYSNRSAAYLSKGDAQNALDDAQACIGLNPDNFSKGYGRKGAALYALKRYNDSIKAYEDGLAKFPNDAALQKGLQDVQKEKDGPSFGSGGGNSLFGPQMMAQMALDPKMRPYLNDPEVMAKLKMAQNDPSALGSMFQDPKMMNVLSAMFGMASEGEEKSEGAMPSTSKAAPSTSNKSTSNTANQAEDMNVEHTEEDSSELPDDERKKKETQKAARLKKEEGNDLYKQKKFDEALAKYDEAIEIEPTNMTYLNNKAAVYFAQKKYDECIDACLKAIEVGKSNRASFEDRAKAYTRAGKAYQKKGDLENAIKMCQESQLESYDKETQRMLKTMELEKKKADALAYQDDEKAEAAKQRGNECFRNQKWGDAVHEYEEAIKRAPKNATYRNNLAAALCKIMDFPGAQRQIEEALSLDPKYVKAWARKGDIEMYHKEHHKAMESYKKGLELDENNAACKDGLRKCMSQISYGRASMTDDEKKSQAQHAMADPEIQSILTDPVVQQVLRDFNENQAAAQRAMADPSMRAKINKLIASGIIETA